MRQLVFLAVLTAVSAMAMSCIRPDDNQDSARGDVEFVDGFNSSYKVDIDTIRYADGSYEVSGMGSGPLNSLLEYFDGKERVCLTQAQASECEPQILLYHYDDSGRLSEIISIAYSDTLVDLSTSGAGYGRSMYEALEAALPLGADSPLRVSASAILFDRSNDGKRLVSVSGLWPIGEIVSPEGKSLNVRIRPVDDFWQSDLNGGRYVLEVSTVE